MKVLVLGLYAEGSTDHNFLPDVIWRTTESVLMQHGRYDIEPIVNSLYLMKVQKKKRDECILQVALDAVDCHALIVHSDADDPDSKKAKIERFDPGFALVQQSSEQICKHLLPVIPVQAIEAWMLADYELLVREIGTHMQAHDLGIPEKARYVEAISKPKQRLREVVQKAYASRSRRHRETDIDFLYEPIGRKISLERLNQVPSYQQFVHDLSEALQTLNLIQYTTEA